ncbi:MAG: hypothetical protein Q8927_07780 [Bacteroidota bacterium]|nr:hypothetical protein [Bacteroidota bacterium]MDP4245293.1 hypothetical protein [Bacteroidota bacterium]MDP4256290.1 hypothetical protein [Bacteroidota bacterium]MDP4260741.1 hypothetical protein [Bacteroidota bacterium]
MNNNSESVYIRQCLQIIEDRWQRGPSGEWTSYDFGKLSQEIFDATGISLSISTLKRLFGKVNYDNLPSVNTLNTLARFTGFEDWNAFKHRTQSARPSPADLASHLSAQPAASKSSDPGPHPSPAIPAASHHRLRWWPLLFLPLGALAYLFLSLTKPSTHRSLDPTAYSFSCNKVRTEGVPNSVVFRYDASAAPTDSVFIVQTWDRSRRTPVSRHGHDHSAIYYYPGYFNARLLIDTQVVRTHDLLIASGGWLAMTEGNPAPFYFRKEEVRRGAGEVVVDSTLLNKYHFPLYPEAPWVRLYYIEDMGPLPDDNFTFETTLRSESGGGSDACQQMEVLIQVRDDAFIIPLSAPACIGDLHLYALGKRVSSKEADLSGLGTDLSQWTRLKIVTVGKHMQIMLNDRPAYSLDLDAPPADHAAPTDIVGVQYRFRGGAAVRDTRFISRGRTIELIK